MSYPLFLLAMFVIVTIANVLGAYLFRRIELRAVPHVVQMQTTVDEATIERMLLDVERMQQVQTERMAVVKRVRERLEREGRIRPQPDIPPIAPSFLLS